MSDTFSERYGFGTKSMKIQKDSVNEGLRTSLWNVLFVCVFDLLWYKTATLRDSDSYPFFVGMWHRYFNWAIDRLPAWTTATIDLIRAYFFECRWYEVYDLLEYIIENYEAICLVPAKWEDKREDLIHILNSSLETGQSAYRLVARKFVPITSEEEIKEIEQASSQGIPNIREHINAAIALLSDRQNPDYRNSIKESISAVEAACCLVSSNPKATLGEALVWLGRNSKLHPALKNGFNSLYGYTSDAEGIRHALMDESTLSFAEAKLMLVMCSTFVNYLLEKASQAGSQIHE